MMRAPRLVPILASTCVILAAVCIWAIWKQPFIELAGFGSNTLDGFAWEDTPADADRSACLKLTYALMATAVACWLPGWLKLVAAASVGYAGWIYYQCLEPHLKTLEKMKALAAEGGAESEALMKTAIDGIKPLIGAYTSGGALVLLGLLVLLQLVLLKKDATRLTLGSIGQQRVLF
jgi:hypothetical protein